MPLRFDILTIFPEMFSPDAPAALGISIPARARAAGLAEWHAHDIRAFTTDKHHKTDDRPYGGGPGMVMMAQPVWDAVHAVEALDPRPATRILLTPQGTPLTQPLVEQFASLPRLLLIAGHYEGLDERVIHKLPPLQSPGGYLGLPGGVLAALALLAAVTPPPPGARGADDSAAQDSFNPAPTTDPNGSPLPPKLLRELGLSEHTRLLDCPHYTKPRIWEGLEVPEVLCSGDHGAVARWRLAQMLARTRERRPDLLGRPDQEPLSGSDLL